VTSHTARRLCIKSFEAGACKRAEPFGVDYPNSDLWRVAFGKLLEMFGHRCRNAPSRYNGDGHGRLREPTCNRLGLKDRLGQKGNQSIAAAFRGYLQLDDVLPSVGIDDQICLHVADTQSPLDAPPGFPENIR
jgi:hypothetical protein